MTPYEIADTLTAIDILSRAIDAAVQNGADTQTYLLVVNARNRLNRAYQRVVRPFSPNADDYGPEPMAFLLDY